MATDYLAAAILSDRQIVTYRLLSRELECHVSEAQDHLDRFQNAHSSAVEAVYIVHGTEAPISSSPNQPGSNDDDDRMSVDGPGGDKSKFTPEHSQQYPLEQVPVTVVMLVPQGRLEQTKQALTSVISARIYSLGPGPIADLELISDCNRRVWEKDEALADPTEQYKYGVLKNPWMRKRATVAARKEKQAQPKPTTSHAATPTSASTTSQISAGSAKPKQDIKDAFKQAASAGPTGKKAAPKSAKSAKGSIFASFSQAQAKEKMAIPDGNDEGETEADLGSFVIKRKQGSAAQLVQPRPASPGPGDLMDTDDGKQFDLDEAEDDMDVDEPEPELEPELEPAPEAEPEHEPEPEPETITQNGRRRGRRRVTKKVRVKDDDGFLVSREEHVWESFSETDAEVDPKPASKPGPKAAPPAKGKKPAEKPQQGSILSFFKKK